MSTSKKIMEIKMIDFGDNLFMRNNVDQIFNTIKLRSNFFESDIILVDFTGVNNISSGFAFDLFQKLKNEVGHDFLKKIRVRFENTADKALINSVIKGAFNSQIDK